MKRKALIKLSHDNANFDIEFDPPLNNISKIMSLPIKFKYYIDDIDPETLYEYFDRDYSKLAG